MPRDRLRSQKVEIDACTIARFDHKAGKHRYSRTIQENCQYPRRTRLSVGGHCCARPTRKRAPTRGGKTFSPSHWWAALWVNCQRAYVAKAFDGFFEARNVMMKINSGGQPARLRVQNEGEPPLARKGSIYHAVWIVNHLSSRVPCGGRTVLLGHRVHYHGALQEPYIFCCPWGCSFPSVVSRHLKPTL
jgi:hypothetical protein